ncbi:hypothetical protein ACSFBM_27895 [Variovorax sp. GB1R11]|jgi:hypothetical protein|uniref:hypothetical protein n=1 Tax=Variovorax sp. GB1R11 TaxID=3443741 RepID=UPI003F48EDFF
MATTNPKGAIRAGTTLRFPDDTLAARAMLGLTWSFYDGDVADNAILAPRTETVSGGKASLEWVFDETQAGRITLRVQDASGTVIDDRPLDAFVNRVDATAAIDLGSRLVLNVELKFD